MLSGDWPYHKGVFLRYLSADCIKKWANPYLESLPIFIYIP
jgi:hypothetical protein